MPLSDISSARIPNDPGVYLMKNRLDQVIYVGKAKNLQKRVSQYLVPGRDSRMMIPHLYAEAQRVDTIVVTSEVEALLLENTLIKRHQPKFNALLKDDKGFSGLHIDTTHPWPALRFLRVKNHPPRTGLFCGPYINALSARQALELAQRVFPLRQCSDEELERRKRPCLLYHMKRCAGPCVNLCSSEEYSGHVADATRFLKGDRRMVIELLESNIERSSEMLDFERANQLHGMLKNLEQLRTGQGVDNPQGGECDAFGIHREGETTVVTRAQYRSGKLQGMQHRFLENIASSFDEVYETLLPQIYDKLSQLAGDVELPTKILINCVDLDMPSLTRALIEITERKLKVLRPLTSDHKRWVQLAAQNAASQFEQTNAMRRARQKILGQLQRDLDLPDFPSHIECIDQSHLGATGGVSAIICYRDGEVSKRDYRRYKVDEWAGDDCAALQAALKKRLERAQREGTWPNLLLIDGGKAQLNAALSVLSDANLIGLYAISISKEKGRHDRGLTGETLHFPDGRTLALDQRSPLLQFLQRVRDEAHRFAIEYQKKRRSANLTKSILDDISGIGPTTKKKLLRHFGSLTRLKQASRGELDSVPGLSTALKTRLCEVLKLQ